MNRDKDILRKNTGSIVELVGNADDDVFALLVDQFCDKNLITTGEANAIKRQKGGHAAASKLITSIRTYVTMSSLTEQQKQEKLSLVLDTMEFSQVNGLQVIVKKMREEYDPVTKIPKVCPKVNTNSETSTDPNATATPLAAKTQESIDGSAATTKVAAFISYTRREGDKHIQRIDKIYATLHADENLDVFKDDRVLKPGDRLTSTLKEEISKRTVFISMLSEKYFDSWWCSEEFKQALEEQKKIIPVVFKNGGGSFQYPQALKEGKFKDCDVGDILHFKFDCQAVHEEAEIARCAKEIIEAINS